MVIGCSPKANSTTSSPGGPIGERLVHLSSPSAIRSKHQPEPVPGAAQESIPRDRVAGKRSPFLPSSRVAHRCQRGLPHPQSRALRHPPFAPCARTIPAKAFRLPLLARTQRNRERRSFRAEFPVPQSAARMQMPSVSLGRTRSLSLRKPVSRTFRVQGCPNHQACRRRWIAFEHRFCGPLR